MDFTRFLMQRLPVAALIFVVTGPTAAQEAKLRKALEIMPKQRDVDFEQPTANELKAYRLEETRDPMGYLVTDLSGRIVRRYINNGGDTQLDEWSYFKNGIEVYRDIDSNEDKKTDAYRWLGTAGTRWGLDPDQDGIIDSWKLISAEEVASEAFEAIRNRDTKRFERLLISSSEIAELELGENIRSDVQRRVTAARQDFPKLVKSQREIGPSTEWVHAGNGWPSIVPAGSDGFGKDVIFYDHASAVFKSRDYGQLSLGTIVEVNPGLWRLIELPEIVEEGKPITNGGAFFPLPELATVNNSSVGTNSPELEKTSQLQIELEKVDKQLSAATKPVEIARLEQQGAEIKQEIFFLLKDPAMKRNWLENLADTVTDAYQRERFPNGKKFLDQFVAKLKKSKSTDGLDYIQFRLIYADYWLANTIGDKKDRDQANEKLIEELKKFQSQFETSPFAADALCQIGIHYEINENNEEASDYYKSAVKRFPDTSFGKRAAGSLVRLQGRGKTTRFVGQSLANEVFNLQDPKWRDKVVVIHFWETWCTDGFDDLQRLVEKYKDDVVFVGCNIEKDTGAFKDYMSENRDINWLQLHAPGSMQDSDLAHQFGVPSEPWVMLFDKEGKLVESDVAFSELERKIERQRRK